MKKISVYDLPTRYFHWFFAILFLVAYLIGDTVDDENPLFTYHMLAGLSIIFLLVLRIIWGFIGTSYARFSSFRMNPAELVHYFKDVVLSKTRKYIGHNPASSYAAIVMFICAIGLAITGISMTTGGEKEFYKDIHEVLANIFLITVIFHLVGIAIHHLRHKDTLWSSMFNGKKVAEDGSRSITGTKPYAGIVLVVLMLMWFGYINSQYDSNTGNLNLFGNQLKLGEQGHESHGTPEYESYNEEHEKD